MALLLFSSSPDEDSISIGDETLGEVLERIETEAKRKLWSVAFTGDRNKFWSPNLTESDEGDDFPFPIQADCELIGAGFTNKRNSVEIDFEIYKNGTANGDLVLTYPFRNSRFAVNNDLSVSFSQGDALYVYGRDRGTNIDKGVVFLYFKSTGDFTGSVSTRNNP